MKKKRLLMAALLAAAVSTQGFAQPEALSEDELEEVSAQGLQIVENHNATFGDHGPLYSQNNNLDSVQVNDGAMSSSITGYGAVLANSAVNSTANYLYDTISTPPGPPQEKSFSNYFEQKNEQTAKNHVNVADPQGDVDEEKKATAANINKESQRIGTGVEIGGDETLKLVIVDQDNNNNSVQLNENAQKESSGMVMINAAASAVNAGENFFYAGSVEKTTGIQSNTQEALNFKNTANAADGTAFAYNGEYEKENKTQVVSNAGLTLSHEGETDVNKNITIEDQDNNNNSVQLNDSAQESASFVTIKNTAKSAVNNGINAVYVSDGFKDSELTQENIQRAYNHVNNAGRKDENENIDTLYAHAYNENKQSQVVDNASYEDKYIGTAKIIDQDNNNNSVQLNDSAQKSAKGVIIENASASAVNKGINLLGTAEITNSTTEQKTIEQKNEQYAYNFNNTALGKRFASARNKEEDSAQYIINQLADIEKQDNNNNSVQLNDEAQKSAMGVVINNVANSAENVGVNVLSGGDLLNLEPEESGDFKTETLTQGNAQRAENHKNYAKVEGDEANTANAYNYNKQRQVVENKNREEGTELTLEDQNNNNNSVQLNDEAQSEVKAGILSNISMSAVNKGANIMAVGDIENSTIEQNNEQNAYNFNNTAKATGGEDTNTYANAYNSESGATQDINNMNEFTNIINQDNNNNSVQLNDEAQKSAMGVVINNVANSAENVGVNVMKTGNITASTITQSNIQHASNHNNAAFGNEAKAENKNKETQVIRNFTVDDPRDLAYIENQNNNNNSVQLNGNAQGGTTTGIMENVSLSASNTALNLLSTGDINVPVEEPDPANYGNIDAAQITQNNEQYAYNFNNTAKGDDAVAQNGEFTEGEFYKTGEPEAGQMIENVHGNIPPEAEQNNNNNSVQLNDSAQYEAKSIIISNMANSASNIAVNMMTTGDVNGTNITQENVQRAYNHVNYAEGAVYAFAGNLNKQKQYIYNCNCTAIDGEQNNNMNSVQLNDNAQAYLNTLVLLNSANSAANVGVNVLHAGIVSGSSIIQKNTATAVNFSNTAIGRTKATAINAENYAPEYIIW